MSNIELIDKPEAKTVWQHISDLSFTSVMWATWLYLFLPVINMLMWVLGLSYYYTELTEDASYIQMQSLFETTGWTIVIAFLVLRLWGLWNYMYFGRPVRDRRHKVVRSTSIDAISEHYKLPPKEVVAIQNLKELVWPMQQGMDPVMDVTKWVTMSKGVTSKNQIQMAQGKPQTA